MDELTAEFVELFDSNPSAYDGIMGRLLAMGHLPDGVNPDDEGVVRVGAEARKRHGKEVQE